MKISTKDLFKMKNRNKYVYFKANKKAKKKKI